ncbi:MAG TPA: bifunctional phosphoribosylaminoimidazolecarboxamide formyltransferase/IMP cyclohydrolase, partial [Candidatus Saccharimonadales bacterium]|nr:bifunctional phosphoribosylaminoimidazolecarboxamide formyltransferase/IMP cyclohydrolase [Candidatus Saccharimonadales bacterium]
MADKTDKYALLSVFDKTGIVELAKTLQSLGYKIISTGGTAKILTQNHISVTPIQEITGNPESFDGRMKTISFQIESGILFDRNNKKHVGEAKKLKIKPIDIVVCNLYPFEQTIVKQNVKLDEAIENIDVGGPTMIRAAAKNFKDVIVLTDPKDYEVLSAKLQGISLEERQKLAAKAFSHLSFYDSQIAKYFGDELFPNEITVPGRKAYDLRYGENPHQKAALYFLPNSKSPLANLEKKWGRDLSFINLTDINAGLEVVKLFTEPAAVIIKHNSPCGIALGSNSKQALERAIASDPESAFGGIVVLNS